MTSEVPGVAAGGVMGRLKAETAEHHARAEGKALQRAMVTGRLPRERYTAWLGQMWLAHLALEAAVERARPRLPALAAVTAEQTHSGRLAEDLSFYGVDAAGVRPLASTRGLVARIEELGASSPAGVLGLHYVLEGSMNGNAYIARAVRGAYGLERGRGDRYLDPYGERQRAVWAEFRGAVDSFAWTAADADAAVEGARVMFEGAGEISEEIGAG